MSDDAPIEGTAELMSDEPAPKRKRSPAKKGKSKPRGNRKPGHASMVAARVRAGKGIGMRAEGASWPMIAEALNYPSRGAAYTAVMDELARQPPRATRETLITEMNEQIDTLLAHEFARALAGGDDQHEAARVCARLLERRAKLLGLDALADQLHVPIDNVQGLIDLVLALSMQFVPKARQAAWMDQVAAAARQIEPSA